MSPPWVSPSLSVKERVWTSWHLQALLILGTENHVGPQTSDRARPLLPSMNSLLFIHLVITSSCQEGEHPSKELLKFYSKFYKFLFPAFWPQIRLYVSYRYSEVGIEEERQGKVWTYKWGGWDDSYAQGHKKGQSWRYRGQNYRLGGSKQTLEWPQMIGLSSEPNDLGRIPIILWSNLSAS